MPVNRIFRNFATMQCTVKPTAVLAAEIVATHGVTDAVVSPGSRDVPLIMALSRRDGIRMHVVVDERSAAFVALGLAETSRRPVVLVCTSGTALLNYLPAVAEAWYRSVPLVVLSADRPSRWIDQDDSQTLHQPGALAPYVKMSADLTDGDTDVAARRLNEAMIAATEGRPAPVHVNMQFDIPLVPAEPRSCEPPRIVRCVEADERLSERQIDELKTLLRGRRTLIVGGYGAPSDAMNRAMSRLVQRPGVAVLCEPTANVRARGVITAVDALMPDVMRHCHDEMCPDALITFGGALVSASLKSYLRKTHPSIHLHVGHQPYIPDCYNALTTVVRMRPETFIRALASRREFFDIGSFGTLWRERYAESLARIRHTSADAVWSDLRAIYEIFRAVPRTANIQLSNGTPVRYAQILPSDFHRYASNRGVSGIDGSTSTAIGAAIAAADRQTVLITGDMSAQYDMGALAFRPMPSNLRIVVMMNGGGNIFRVVDTTRCLPELEKYLEVGTNLPLSHLAAGFGIRYYEAHDVATLRDLLPEFLDMQGGAALMAVTTDGSVSADIMRKLYH